MADHTMNALYGLRNTLTDIVAPSVSAEDPLAQQELRMATRYLEFLHQRVEHLHERARFELRLQRDVGEQLRSPELDRAIVRADALLASPAARIAELHQCARDLETATSEIVRAARDDPGTVERTVVTAAAELTGFERSWYLPLGMDHFTEEVRPLESYLGAGAHDD